jgi:hypothetical protein
VPAKPGPVIPGFARTGPRHRGARYSAKALYMPPGRGRYVNCTRGRPGNYVAKEHPRVCGADPRAVVSPDSRTGAPPRVRGGHFATWDYSRAGGPDAGRPERRPYPQSDLYRTNPTYAALLPVKSAPSVSSNYIVRHVISCLSNREWLRNWQMNAGHVLYPGRAGEGGREHASRRRDCLRSGAVSTTHTTGNTSGTITASITGSGIKNGREYGRLDN